MFIYEYVQILCTYMQVTLHRNPLKLTIMLTINPTDYIYVTADNHFGHVTQFSGSGFASVSDIIARVPSAIGMTTLTIRNASRGFTGRVPVYRARIS